jgi:hypothetical protein
MLSPIGRKSLTALGIAAIVVVTVTATRHASAQSSDVPPTTLESTCPVDTSVRVVQIPHRERVTFVSPAGSQHQRSDQIFTGVPVGWNFRVTHISTQFFSQVVQTYTVALLRVPGGVANNTEHVASFSPNEDGTHPLNSTEFYRTGNFPWDANYLRESDTPYYLFTTRLNGSAPATTRVTFDGYLEPGCDLVSPRQ